MHGNEAERGERKEHGPDRSAIEDSHRSFALTRHAHEADSMGRAISPAEASAQAGSARLMRHLQQLTFAIFTTQFRHF